MITCRQRRLNYKYDFAAGSTQGHPYEPHPYYDTHTDTTLNVDKLPVLTYSSEPAPGGFPSSFNTVPMYDLSGNHDMAF